MSLNKKIYEISKKFFKDKLTTAFESKKQSEDINSPQNLFAINCVRYLLNDELAFIDPIEKENDFKNFAKFVRLNDFQANGKPLDTGTGTEIANNLIYRLAIKFLKTKNENIEQIESKITLVNKAFSYPDFEGEFLLNVFMDEPETYQCITKQAFYKWHYSTYVNETPIQEKIPQQNFLNLSSLGWTSVDVPLLTSKLEKKTVNPVFYVSQNGSPYNTGFPIVCAVFDVGGIKGIDQFLASDRFNEIEMSLEEQVSNIFNREKNGLNSFTRVKKITHKNLLTIAAQDVVYEASISKAGKPLVRFCLAYDYQELVFLKPKEKTKQSFYGKVKFALSQNKNAVISFKSTQNVDTISIINSQVEHLSKSLTLRNDAVQMGPALFFDLTDPSIKAAKDSFKKQGLDEQTANAILARQYSLNLSTLSLALTREYSFLTETYLTERRTNSLFKNFDPNRISEDISFYYDESYRLLAIVGENKTVEFNTRLAEQPPIQKNLVPFEYEEQGTPLSNLDSLFSLLPEIVDDQDAFSNTSGINGEIAFITEDFVDIVSKQKEFETVDFSGRSIVLSNQHYQQTILKVPTDPLSVIVTSINGFFYNSNEILLSDQRGPSAPPVISQKLLKAPTNKIIDFFESNDTPDSIGLINNQDISKFLLRYHYPRLQISPSVIKQPAQQVLGTVLEGTRRLVNITKNALEEGRIDPNRTSDDEKELLKRIKQIPKNSPFFSKQKFKEESKRQLLIIAAASSKDPCLKDLSKIIARGGLDALYEHVLTKFDWDQLVAKALLEKLDTVNKIAQTVGDIKNIAEAVNNCLDSLGIEDILESYTNLKNGYRDIEKYLNYATKEIPGLKNKIKYTLILDFEELHRELILQAFREAGVRALDFILASVLSELRSFCELDDKIEKLILEKFNDGANLNLLGGPDIAGNSIGSNSVNFSQEVEKKFEVDIIEIINNSNIEPLDNVLNGAVEIFPILSIESNKLSDSTLIIREYLDALSSNITPRQLKSLLDGTQTDDLIKLNKIIVEDLSTTELVKNELSSSIALAILFKYLDDFISRVVLDELVFGSINQTADSCFVKISVADSDQRQILQDFLNTSSNPNEPLSDQLNNIANFITGLCSQINNVLNLDEPGAAESLLSDFERGNLAGLVDANVQGATILQDSSKQEALDLTKEILQDLDDYISGIKTNSNSKFTLKAKISNSQFLSPLQKKILSSVLNDLKPIIPKDIIPLLQEFVESPDSKSITISGLGPKKIEIKKDGENIIISIGGQELLNFKPEKIAPENLIGSPIQLKDLSNPNDVTGYLFYYETILNRMATNKTTKGSAGYTIEIYKPDEFKEVAPEDSQFFKPFVDNFFKYLAGKIQDTTTTLPIQSQAFDISVTLESIFQEQQVLKQEIQNKLTQTIDESTSGTEFYMSNLAKMKQLINKAKG